RLSKHDNRKHGKNLKRLPNHDGRIEQHSHCDEKQNRESILDRLKIFGCAVTKIGFVHDYTGKKRTQGKGNAKEFGGTKRNTQGERYHSESEQLARASPFHSRQEPRKKSHTGEKHEGNEHHDLSNGDPERRQDASVVGVVRDVST